MWEPVLSDAFQVLLLQLADGGRGEVLLGDSVERARSECLPFLIGEECPSVYLEFPLVGDPFLDVTMLYGSLVPGTRVLSDAAAGTEGLLDWFASTCSDVDNVCFGFELDTSKPELPSAGVHFQPRRRLDLVEPFCEALGEPARARLYLELDAHMPKDWALSFFGLFRGRPEFPLRVCGYLGPDEKDACAHDAGHLPAIFDAIGFEAYDDAMLAQMREVMAMAPGSLDFQFDVFPDGRLGDVFALDVQYEIARPDVVRESFEHGPIFQVMNLVERMGAADGRWRLAADAAFARAIPAVREDGTIGRYSFTLMPQWMKVRWKAGLIQPSKLYYLGSAGFLGEEDGDA